MEKTILIVLTVIAALGLTACESSSATTDNSQSEEVLKMQQKREQYQPQAPGN
ncbi:hypothetical protein [Cerasicoccus fimbriatus]|uniref:hypothetical protein n=1 Tax=Cerasicoccus fimbriatus TaxID=3014554 RepID=UPI0022B55043|nr:hypothetical protein [Cerasicoccus sp. TK19100]